MLSGKDVEERGNVRFGETRGYPMNEDWTRHPIDPPYRSLSHLL